MAPTSNFSPLMGQFACLQATTLSAVQSLWGRGCSCARSKSQVFMPCGSQLSWVPGKMSAIRCGNASIHLSKTGQQFLARNCTVHQSAMVHASAVILASRKYMHCCRWTNSVISVIFNTVAYRDILFNQLFLTCGCQCMNWSLSFLRCCDRQLRAASGAQRVQSCHTAGSGSAGEEGLCTQKEGAAGLQQAERAWQALFQLECDWQILKAQVLLTTINGNKISRVCCV